MKIRSVSHAARRAFTLIELLIVIVIIAILAAISFPVYNNIFGQAEETQAAKECTDLASAIESFFADYNRFPVPLDEQSGGGSDTEVRTDKNFMDYLNGDDNTINRKKEVYYVGKEGKVDRGGMISEGQGWKLVDPWAQLYYVIMDTNFDDHIEDIPTEQGNRNAARAVVYSSGPDRDLNMDEDNPKSW